MYKKNKAFTIVELIAVLVILSIIVLITVPLILSIKSKAKLNAYKRSIDAYGKSLELAISSNLMDKGAIPNDLSTLKTDYVGSKVICNVKKIKENGGVFLSECTVNGKSIKDKKTEDGWYHYNNRDLTNEEYVVLYGKSLEKAIKKYYNENKSYPSDYRNLALDYIGKKVTGNIIINYDGTIFIENPKVTGVSVDMTYGTDKSTAVKALLNKINIANITDYEDGKTSEMYIFEHGATEQTSALTDYRYIGNNPSNYVIFNNELWRIIGIFKVDDGNGNMEEKLKIVRNEQLENNLSWDSSYKPEWVNSSLHNYLNSDYYSELNDNFKNMVSSTRYYLGGNYGISGSNADSFYVAERGTQVFDYQRNMLSTNWVGKIALMYPSDYLYTYALYVNNKCFENPANCKTENGGIPEKSWIYNTNNNSDQWLLNTYHVTSSGNRKYSINYRGTLSGTYVEYRLGIRPTLYLKSSVKIISGDGSEQNPYQLSL